MSLDLAELRRVCQEYVTAREDGGLPQERRATWLQFRDCMRPEDLLAVLEATERVVADACRVVDNVSSIASTTSQRAILAPRLGDVAALVESVAAYRARR